MKKVSIFCAALTAVLTLSAVPADAFVDVMFTIHSSPRYYPPIVRNWGVAYVEDDYDGDVMFYDVNDRFVGFMQVRLNGDIYYYDAAYRLAAIVRNGPKGEILYCDPMGVAIGYALWDAVGDVRYHVYDQYRSHHDRYIRIDPRYDNRFWQRQNDRYVFVYNNKPYHSHRKSVARNYTFYKANAKPTPVVRKNSNLRPATASHNASVKPTATPNQLHGRTHGSTNDRPTVTPPPGQRNPGFKPQHTTRHYNDRHDERDYARQRGFSSQNNNTVAPPNNNRGNNRSVAPPKDDRGNNKVTTPSTDNRNNNNAKVTTPPKDDRGNNKTVTPPKNDNNKDNNNNRDKDKDNNNNRDKEKNTNSGNDKGGVRNSNDNRSSGNRR